jgi:hypothetical protein
VVLWGAGTYGRRCYCTDTGTLLTDGPDGEAKLIVDNLFKSVNYIRTADEIFVLIRDLCAIPCMSMSKLMQSLGLVGFLCYFATPDLVPQVIQTMFEKNFPQQQTRANTNVHAEYTNLLQNVYESIAALLGCRN